MSDVKNLEETLNGGYRGLHHEVWIEDTYQLKDIKFKPVFFLDLGMNIGEATRFALSMWPECKIVGVEPNPDNFEDAVRFTPYPNVTFLNKAIGTGRLWTFSGAVNGAHEMFINTGVGYPELSKEEDERLSESPIETVMLDELVDQYWTAGGSILKIDIEGNETKIWEHEPSMRAMRKFDYICGETHPFALHGGLIQGVKDAGNNALNSLSDQFDVRIHGTSFWLTKK